MDVKSTFLHGELNQEICMNQAREFNNQAHPDIYIYTYIYICKLRKVLYSFKQASRAWHCKITKFLTHSGSSVAYVDSSLFVKTSEGKLTTILVYVDDFIFCDDE